MNSIYLSLLISSAIALGAGLLSPDVADLIERSQTSIKRVDAINRAQVIEAASIFFMADRGRQPASVEELVAEGYLKPSILE